MKIQRLTWFALLLSSFVIRVVYAESPTPTGRDVISEVIEQAAKQTSKSQKPSGDTTKLEPWQTSPDQFAKEVQRLFSKGADENELAKRFRGKEVRWPGILARVEKKASGAGVIAGVWITDVSLVAPDGTPANIGLLALDFPNFVMPADKHIRFRATLSDVSAMPVINEKDHSKKNVVMVETEGDTGVIEGTTIGHDEDWCQRLLKAPIEKYLPNGYSNPKISLTEMTPTERAGGMRCKISVNLQGPARFNTIRFRVYEDAAAAERGLKSLSKTLPPDITVIDDRLSYHHGTVSSPGRDSPCMVYTAGDRTQTFVTCADQIEGEPVVMSGVASQPRDGSSYDMNTVDRAAKLLGAGMDNYEDLALDRAFGKDQKK